MRRLEIFIPIVLLAMWVQLLVPIAAFGMMAQAAANPLIMSEICHGAQAENGAENTPASQPDIATCCAICSIGHGGQPALDLPPPVFVKLQLDYRKLSWSDAFAPAHHAAVRTHVQARAPPAIS